MRDLEWDTIGYPAQPTPVHKLERPRGKSMHPLSGFCQCEHCRWEREALATTGRRD